MLNEKGIAKLLGYRVITSDETLKHWFEGDNGNIGIVDERILLVDGPGLFGKPKLLKEWPISSIANIEREEHFEEVERTKHGRHMGFGYQKAATMTKEKRNFQVWVALTFDDGESFIHHTKHHQIKEFIEAGNELTQPKKQVLKDIEAKKEDDQRVQAEFAREQLKRMKEGKDPSSADDPLKILSARYAKGEITKKEYLEMKKTLE